MQKGLHIKVLWLCASGTVGILIYLYSQIAAIRHSDINPALINRQSANACAGSIPAESSQRTQEHSPSLSLNSLLLHTRAHTHTHIHTLQLTSLKVTCWTPFGFGRRKEDCNHDESKVSLTAWRFCLWCCYSLSFVDIGFWCVSMWAVPRVS